jgi:hypothetical protein
MCSCFLSLQQLERKIVVSTGHFGRKTVEPVQNIGEILRANIYFTLYVCYSLYIQRLEFEIRNMIQNLRHKK